MISFTLIKKDNIIIGISCPHNSYKQNTIANALGMARQHCKFKIFDKYEYEILHFIDNVLSEEFIYNAKSAKLINKVYSFA